MKLTLVVRADLGLGRGKITADLADAVRTVFQRSAAMEI